MDGQLSNEPLHNDGADSFRYFAVASGSGRHGTTSAIAAKLAAAKSRAAEVAAKLTGGGGYGSTGQGWMK